MQAHNRKTFNVKYKSPETGQIVEGTFTTKRLSIRDRSEIGRRRSQLAGGMYCVRDDEGNPTGQGLDEETDYLNAMIAHLEVSLVQKPQWWDLQEISDLGLVREVYQQVGEFESSFFRLGQKDGGPEGGGRDGVGAENGSSEPAATGSGDVPTPVVGEEVQAALDA